MTVDPSVVPGLLFLLAELVALVGVGYVIVLVALRETDRRVALAQGLIVGPAIWGVVVNLVMFVLPGMAGAIAGWVFVLTLAAVLVWRSSKSVRPRLRVTAVLALAILAALFWIALASRQMLWITDAPNHLGVAASIRAGIFPPELSWIPGTPVPYHYGAYMLMGLLAPPSGPNLAFVHELLSAYAWASLVLVVGTALLRRGGWFSALILTPLLLSTGAWTFERALELIHIPIPEDLPTAGIRASLTEIYWPPTSGDFAGKLAALPNIWKPAFPLAYGLAFIVLQRAASSERRTWPAILTLAALTGYLGLTSSTLTPVVLFLWAGLEAIHFVKCRRAGSSLRMALGRPVCGLAVAALLTLTGASSALILGESTTSGLSLGWVDNLHIWRPLGAFETLPGGVALLGLGPLAVAGVAALAGWRDRFVLALTVGALMLMVAALVLRYDPAPHDLGRLAGHARNLALLALLLALSSQMAKLGSRWRYAAGALLVGLVVWPTISAPVSNLRRAIERGIEVANAGPALNADGQWLARRHKLRGLPDRIADFIRNNTAVDPRVFSPNPHEMTYATGRPNASGLAGLVHVHPREGPTYKDVLNFLEMAAIRRLGIEYIHAPDSWVESLPDDAVERLKDPRLFEPLVRDESESLYRVLPAFLTLDVPPAAGSFESLRQAVPESATVLISEGFESILLYQTAWPLSHARLLGSIEPNTVHLRSPWQIGQVGEEAPDLIITPVAFLPWALPPAAREPIWWDEQVAVYALNGAVDPIMPPPPSAEPLQFSVRISDVSDSGARIAFTATFDDGAPDLWSSQDWVLIATDPLPWNPQKQVLPNGPAAIAVWFISYLNPGKGTTSLIHEFDFHAPSLAVQREHGVFKPLERSEGVLDADSYVLAVRLRHEDKPNQWRDTAIIPVLRITVSDTGEVSYEVHEDLQGG
ncbi:MAG: hypothetical protein OXG11_01180 [Chloroflexi bacterium]|nr:hypothetical protein [Chloroflexota bacterium]